MIVKKDYALFCENVVVDDVGRVTIINSFNKIFTEAVPALHPKLAFTCAMTTTDVTEKDLPVTFKFRANSPSGKIVAESDITSNIKDTAAGQTPLVTINVAPLFLEEFGEYKFSLHHSNKLVASRVLEVVKGNEDDAKRK